MGPLAAFLAPMVPHLYLKALPATLTPLKPQLLPRRSIQSPVRDHGAIMAHALCPAVVAPRAAPTLSPSRVPVKEPLAKQMTERYNPRSATSSLVPSTVKAHGAALARAHFLAVVAPRARLTR